MVPDYCCVLDGDGFQTVCFRVVDCEISDSRGLDIEILDYRGVDLRYEIFVVQTLKMGSEM